MPNKKAKSNTPAASPKGRRVTSAIRARGLHNFLDDITRLRRAYGFRIESEDVGRSLAIFDEREERPAIWPVVAFAKSIGSRVKNLSMQSIMPGSLE